MAAIMQPNKRRSNSLMAKKQLQWQEEKAQQCEWFPFGVQRRLHALQRSNAPAFVSSSSNAVSVSSVATSIQRCTLHETNRPVCCAQSIHTPCNSQPTHLHQTLSHHHQRVVHSAPYALNFTSASGCRGPYMGHRDQGNPHSHHQYLNTAVSNHNDYNSSPSCGHSCHSSCCCCRRRCCCSCSCHNNYCSVPENQLVLNHVRMTQCELVHRALSPIGSDFEGNFCEHAEMVGNYPPLPPSSVSPSSSALLLAEAACANSSATVAPYRNFPDDNYCPSLSDDSCGSESSVTRRTAATDSAVRTHHRRALITKLVRTPESENEKKLYEAEIQNQMSEKNYLKSVQEQAERLEAERIEKDRRILEDRDEQESLKELNKWKKLKEEEDRRMQLVRSAWEKARAEADALKRAKLLQHSLSGEKAPPVPGASLPANKTSREAESPIPALCLSPDSEGHVTKTSTPDKETRRDRKTVVLNRDHFSILYASNLKYKEERPIQPMSADFVQSPSPDTIATNESMIIDDNESRDKILKIYELESASSFANPASKNRKSDQSKNVVDSEMNAKLTQKFRNMNIQKQFFNRQNEYRRENSAFLENFSPNRNLPKNFNEKVENTRYREPNKIDEKTDEKYACQNNDRDELDIIRKMQDLERKLRLEQQILSDKLSGQKRH